MVAKSHLIHHALLVPLFTYSDIHFVINSGDNSTQKEIAARAIIMLTNELYFSPTNETQRYQN